MSWTKILNHTSGTVSGVARVYEQNQYLEERRAALATWGNYVLALVEGREEKKVVQL